MLISPTEGISVNKGPSIRTILQNEAAECGLACLSMIATAFGHEVSLAELRRRFAVSSKGMNLQGIMAAADGLGMTARPIKLELEEVQNLKGPAILHWDLNHFVVFERRSRGKFLIHDPSRGRRWVDKAEADRSFTGVAIEFMRTPSFSRRERSDHVEFSDMFYRAKGLFPSIWIMLFLAFVMQLLALVLPILNQLSVDEAITKGDSNLLNVIAIGMTILIVSTAGIKVLQGLVGLYMGTQLSFQMQTNLLRHTLRLPVSWFEKRHIGDIISRFSSLEPVQRVILETLPSTLLNSIVGLVTLLMMFIYSPTLALLEILVVVIATIAKLSTFPYIRRLTDETLHLAAKVQTTFLETVRGARTFKVFGQERERVSIWQNEQALFVNSQVSLAKLSIWSGAGSNIITGVQQVIIWFVGAKLVISGKITLGMLFAFQAYAMQFGSAASAIILNIFAYKTTGIHLERLADVVHADEEEGLENYTGYGRNVEGRLTLKDVSFRYADQEPWILEGVNLTIEPGDFICFQGPSGQGKTTLLKILLGFEEPQLGQVLIDGIPIYKFGMSAFRNNIGVVLQDDQLFAGTISDNISFFDAEVDQQRVEQAAQQAAVHEEIVDFPMGYQTFTGDLGSSLSAGQRQRVLLARALYRRPSILFLDEGTANLDPESERRVMETVRELSITRVTVAHRPQAALGASRLITVDNGTLVERATS